MPHVDHTEMYTGLNLEVSISCEDILEAMLRANLFTKKEFEYIKEILAI